MRRASLLAVMLLLVSLGLESGTQSNPVTSSSQNRGAEDQQAAGLPSIKHTFRPKLPMQDALKIAEGYIDQQHIDISTYWLSQARYILYGDQNAAYKEKIPCWHFWWMSDTAATGDYVEILVDMNGNAWRVPSM